MALAALVCLAVGIVGAAIMTPPEQRYDYSFGIEYLLPGGILLCGIGLAAIFGIIALVQKAL